jgi:Mrp family chromosome partitioning ATPase
MSRMFNMLSGAVATRPEPAAPRPVVAAVPEQCDEDGGFADAIDDTPFVEIGGPAGPVFSAGPVAVKTTPKPHPPASLPPEPQPTLAAASQPVEVAPKPVAREFPRLASSPRYLSVTFHDLSGATRAPAALEGPDPALVALHLPDHPVSGEYRVLRDEIRLQLPEPTPRVLLFTAAASEAGTTTVLLNLAVTLAREEAPRVLVIDGNVNRPAIARMMAVKPTPGLVEVLAEQVPLTWAFQASAVPNLQVLAAGAATGGTALAIGEDLPRLIGQLRQWYDWVLIDGGVWGTVPERDGTCPSADAVYLVTREADAVRPEFAGLRGWVKQLGGLLRGYVATRV